MRRPSNCDCHCDTTSDCFGCVNKRRILDVQCDIGAITGGGPEDSTCTIPLSSYAGGVNCHICGTVPCGDLLATGSTEIEYHSVKADWLAGEITLQRNPNGTCAWRKRVVKLVQSVCHKASYTVSAWPPPFTVTGAIGSVHETHVTYPYVDPVDPNDQWSPVVFPASDPRCFQPISGFPGLRWLCFNSSRPQVTLILEIVDLYVLQAGDIGGYYDCLAGQTIFAAFPYNFPGTKYWQLSLNTTRARAAATTLTTTGATSLPGAKLGDIDPYDYADIAATYDPCATTTGSGGCPPFNRINRSDWCNVSDGSGLISGHGVTCLRWTKPVDCDNDFNGDPIELTLDAPRAFPPASGLPDCFCNDYHLNARAIDVTGYNTTAIIQPIYA